MAKSARASAVKKNKSNLKKRVFGPVETARNDRLSAKLLELASQPKPPKAEMEVEQDGKSQQICTRPKTSSDQRTNVYISSEANNAANSEAKEDKATEGASQSSLSIPIPACLLRSNDQNLPSPPTTPTLDASASAMTTPILDLPAQKELSKELLFFHLLGASTDILGFDANGGLKLSFAGDSR